MDWNKVTDFLSNADHVLVASHLHPDGDAICSTLVASQVLVSMGKQVTLVNESVIPYRLRFLPGIEKIQRASDVKKSFRYAVVVDCGDLGRLGDTAGLLAEDVQLVNIDHHRTNDLYGGVNMVDPMAAATVQILHRWVQFLEMEISLTLATWIYTGLFTDTGGFRFSNTTPEVLSTAAHLVQQGADPHRIAEAAMESISLPHLRLLTNALNTLRIEGDIAWMSISYEDMLRAKADVEDVDGLVQYTRNIIGVEVGVLFYEVAPGMVKVSFRSCQYFDVGAFAATLGGGGHAKAAGCTRNGSLFVVREEVLCHLFSAMGKK